jgi:hypothetical protein
MLENRPDAKAHPSYVMRSDSGGNWAGSEPVRLRKPTDGIKFLKVGQYLAIGFVGVLSGQWSHRVSNRIA